MTLPHERINALRATHRFLIELLEPRCTPGVPRAIRRRASACLKHFPWLSEIDTLEDSGLPDFDSKAHAKALARPAKRGKP